MLAPIILFVYNRPRHTEKAIAALAGNDLASQSALIVFSDGPRSEQSAEAVDQVRGCIRRVSAGAMFAGVRLVEAPSNKGLANSVIEGVSAVLSEYGRAIVIEDDVIVSPLFLEYMNRALDAYEHDARVGWIGGYTVPAALPEDYEHDVFLSGRGSSCAWAIWKDRWEQVDWDVKDYRSFRHDPFKRARFNAWGTDRAMMLDDQMLGRIDSWAIRLAYHMCKHGLVAVLPRVSLAHNIGFDGSGTHGVTANGHDPALASTDERIEFVPLRVDERIRAAYRRFYHVGLRYRLGFYVKRVLFGGGADRARSRAGQNV
jgi:hypothetical protein